MQFVRETATIFVQTITGTLTVHLVPQEEIVPLTGDNAHTPLPHLSLSLFWTTGLRSFTYPPSCYIAAKEVIGSLPCYNILKV